MRTYYCNAAVYTGQLPLQEAFAVEDGKFVFVGSNAEVMAMQTEDDTLVNLEGAFVCSGFNDSHMHVLNYGSSLRSALLGQHTDSLEGMINYLIDFKNQGNFAPGSWITGRGWNQDYFCDADRMPNRYDLDKVSTENPVIVVRACGHALVVNSKALELIGVTAQTPCPDGGTIGIDNGEPNGRFFDNAMGMVYDAIPVPNKDEVKEMLIAASRALNSYGVTSAQTDDYCVYRSLPWQTINDAYKELAAEGKLTVRIYEQSNFTNVPDLDDFIAKGNHTGVGDDMFKVGPLKMLGDGALGARTAYLSVPYADDADAVGLPVFTQQQLDEMVDCAVKNNMQVAIHAIGDACLENVLNAYEKAFAKYHPVDHRCGIVHCQISRPEQLQRIADLGLHVYAQSIFLDYDINIVEVRVGKELASSSYSWKTLMNKGVCVSNGTDCPVELPNALGGIQCGVTRKTLKGVGPYLENEAFTVQEALDTYTKNGARASFEENVKGCIKEGMLADFVVLGGNPFEVPAETINELPVLGTYLGGRQVW